MRSARGLFANGLRRGSDDVFGVHQQARKLSSTKLSRTAVCLTSDTSLIEGNHCPKLAQPGDQLAFRVYPKAQALA